MLEVGAGRAQEIYRRGLGNLILGQEWNKKMCVGGGVKIIQDRKRDRETYPEPGCVYCGIVVCVCIWIENWEQRQC